MRLAWFTPWPPQRSGVAGRSAELVPLLAARGMAIDVFVDERVVPADALTGDDPPAAGEVRVQSAHQFVWRQARGQYDLAVYQVGNSRTHEFLWPYLFRWPGLVVLHDARLHHARARALLSQKRTDDYRAEFAWNHPDVAIASAELAVAGLSGNYYYQWPMTRAVVDSARLVATHSRGAREALAELSPSQSVEYVALGEGPDHPDHSAGARFRAAHDLAEDAIVFAVFGALTADKRVPQILDAFAATHAHAPASRLLLVGAPDPQLDLDGLVRAHDLADVVRVVPETTDDQFMAAIAAADVALNLRWPTALETSGPWLRCLAMSRPTVVMDLAHQSHVPTLDPRTWRRHAPCEDVSGDADDRAIAVAIDILDEAHSLRLAMRRLAVDANLRARLGRAGRDYWEREHTVSRMSEDYARTISLAATRPTPRLMGPAHLTPLVHLVGAEVLDRA